MDQSRPGGGLDRLDLREPFLRALPGRDRLGLQGRQIALAVADARERRGDPVVFLLEDRVELVVVAAGAVDRQAEEGLADGAEDVLHLVGSNNRLHNRALLVLPGGVISPRHKEPRRLRRAGVIGPEHVARDLQAGELVIRHVAIQRLDDPVAISPGVRAELVVFVPVALAVTSQVEPPSRPADAVLWRFEQPIDQPRIGIGGVVPGECIDLVGRGRQSDQVEAQAPDERQPVGFRGGGHPFGGQLLGQEGVDRRSGFRPLGDLWLFDRVERPPIAPARRVVVA